MKNLKTFIISIVLLVIFFLVGNSTYAYYNDAVSYYDIGNKKMDLAMYKEAIAYYNKAIALGLEDFRVYVNRGNAKSNLKYYKEAINDYNKAIELNPNYVHSYYYRGNSNYKLDNYKKAVSDYEIAIKLDSNNYLYYERLGTVKYILEDYASAIENYSKAINLNKWNERLYISRGLAETNIGQYADAFSDYENAHKIFSEDAKKQILELKKAFKSVSFLFLNIHNVTKYFGGIIFYLFLLLLLVDILLMFKVINYNFKQKDFKNYTKNDVINILNKYIPNNSELENIKDVNINDFDIKNEDWCYLAKLHKKISDYKQIKKPNKILIIILSVFFVQTINRFYFIYFSNTIYESEVFCVGLILSFILVYFSIQYLYNFFDYTFFKYTLSKSDNIKQYSKYLLYLDVYDLYKETLKRITNENIYAKAEEKRLLRKKIEQEKIQCGLEFEKWLAFWNRIKKNGYEFEKEIALLYKKLGYKTELTKATGDGGVDLILEKEGKITIVQCKAYASQVGPEPVRALWGVKDDFNAEEAIFIAYSGATLGAYNFTKGKNLKIMSIYDIIKLCIEVYSEKV